MRPNKSSSLPDPLERDQVVATANVVVADKDLRDGRPAIGALDHGSRASPPKSTEIS